MLEPMSEYPDFHLDAKRFPVVKSWETGKTYRVTMEIRQMSKNEHEAGRSDAGFKIVSMKAATDPTQMNANQHKKYIAGKRKEDYPKKG